MEREKPVTLKAGDTIYISQGLRHSGFSSTVPRICLSTEARGYVPREDVTYYFGDVRVVNNHSSYFDDVQVVNNHSSRRMVI